MADWNGAHTASPYCSPGACYNPDPNLAQVNGHEGSLYFAVNPLGGRVENYTMAFNPDTPQAQASAVVMGEFPSDATMLWSVKKDTCFDIEVASKQLSAVLGGSQEQVIVEFDSDEDTNGNYSYSASSVREAIVGPGNYTSSADAPAC